MKSINFPCKFIAAFMAFVIVLIALPQSSFALVHNEIEQIDGDEGEINENNWQDVFIVEEDKSKRGQFEKHYLCSDGTYISVTYPEAVHYLDANSQWQDVDQTLTYDSSKEAYISDKTDFDVSFSGQFSSADTVQIKRNGHCLSWGIQTSINGDLDISPTMGDSELLSENSNSVLTSETDNFVLSATVRKESVLTAESISDKSPSNESISRLIPISSSPAAKLETSASTNKTELNLTPLSEASFELPKTSSGISYSGISDGETDFSLKYTVYHNKIEEDIIIYERSDLKSVSMNMEVGSLTPVVKDNGSVDLVDISGDMQFHIGIPYMTDACGSVCNDIAVTAVKDGTNCVITYTPDSDWFESESRVFPVLLDPSITTNDYVSNILDTYVEENSSADHSSEQLLYFTQNPANGNRRNIIVRITKLPAIDPSMPIISASLALTAQSAPDEDINLIAYYLDTSLDLSEYTYSLASNTYNFCSFESYLSSGSTTVTFDVSSNIYGMYDDLDFDNEYGYDYCGDFIIGYTDSDDTADAYPFYSSEYTITGNRPVFTVKYGYTLPAGILNGGIYSFRNAESYSYITVNGTNPANGSNVYQQSNDETPETTQTFRLEYVSSSGGYLLYSMASSSGYGNVLGINRGSGELCSGNNVIISSSGDSISQEWLIVPVDYNLFRIVPRVNMSLTLTANGVSDGSNSGTTSSSSGNIYVETLSEDSRYQQWYIYDDSENELSTDRFSSSIDTGDYYISSNGIGKYLHRTNNVANCHRMQANYSDANTVKWKIFNLGDGYCTIGRSDYPGFYIVPYNNNNGSGLLVRHNLSENIPDNYKWLIKPASGGDYLIQNKQTGYYLYAVNDSSSNASSVFMRGLYSVGTDDYRRETWRIISDDDYVELGTGVTFDDISVDIDSEVSASVNKTPASANWSSYTDFDYTIISGSEYVSYNATTRKFTGLSSGTAQIQAVHRTTGITRSFNITVQCISVVVPCVYAETASYVSRGFPVSLSPYLSDYSTTLTGVTWNAVDNGVISFDSANMQVTGLDTGLAWLEAKRNNVTVLICYVYVENILKDFSPDVQDYLYLDGTAIGTISCMVSQANNGIDPYILRVEWYLYAIQLLNQGKSDEEIRTGLNQQFGLSIASGNTFRLFISEIELGSRGGYARQNLKLSFDGLKCLFNFYWLQYAAYSIATLDTVNVYTPATAQDVIAEKEYAESLCKNSYSIAQNIKQSFTNNPNSNYIVIGTNYNGVSWNVVGQNISAKYFYSSNYDNIFATYPNETISANRNFLYESLVNGDTIYCSHNPAQYFNLSNQTIVINNSFGMELKMIYNYYTQMGYSISYSNKSLFGSEEVWEIIIGGN